MKAKRRQPTEAERLQPYVDMLMKATRNTAPLCMAEFLIDLESQISVMGDPSMLEYIDSYPAAAQQADYLVEVASAFTRLYPDPLQGESFRVLADARAMLQPIASDNSRKVFEVTGRAGDVSRHYQLRLSEWMTEHGAALKSVIELARAHDLQHGMPDPPAEFCDLGEVKASQLADVARGLNARSIGNQESDQRSVNDRIRMDGGAVILDGKRYSALTPKAEKMIRMLIAARGRWVKGEKMGIGRPGLIKLPKPIKAVIQSESGKGFRLTTFD